MRFHNLKIVVIPAALMLVVLSGRSPAADWRQFRGSDQTSAAASEIALADDVERHIAWKKEVPGRAVSGPIVVGDRIIVTSSGGPKHDHLYVASFNAKTGDRLWQREFWATGRTLHHPTSANAAPTPCSDGELVFAFYSSNDLVCLDLAGNVQWLRGLTVDYPAAYNDTGMASSPVVIGDAVVVQVECQGDSFAAGLDKRTGANRWRIDRKKDANWASPIAFKASDGQEVVLLQSGDKLTAHDPATGRELWTYTAACSTIPSAVVSGDVIYVPSAGLTAVKASSSGAAPTVLWKENKLSPSSASPVLADNKLYTINGAGILACADANDGAILWQTRLKGPFWATPVATKDYIYAVNQDGLLQVVKLGDKGEIVAKYEFGDQVLGSPAVSDDGLFFRTASALVKVAD